MDDEHILQMDIHKDQRSFRPGRWVIGGRGVLRVSASINAWRLVGKILRGRGGFGQSRRSLNGGMLIHPIRLLVR